MDSDEHDVTNSDDVSRIRPEDELIKLAAVQAIMGGVSTSTIYEDVAIMGLKIEVSPHSVRWIAREIYQERARRVAQMEYKTAGVRARVEARRERRRARQLQTAAGI